MKLKLCTIFLTVVMALLSVTPTYCDGPFPPRTAAGNFSVIGGSIFVNYRKGIHHTTVGGPVINKSYFYILKSTKDVEEIGGLFPSYSEDSVGYSSAGEHKIYPNTFENCTKLKYVELIGFDNMEIGENAFKNCTELRRVILPYCKSIADNAFDGCDKSKLVISCKPDSVAENYAKRNGIKYDNSYEKEYLEFSGSVMGYHVDTTIVGDVNLDGKITSEDASLLTQYIINKDIQDTTDTIFLMNCDVDVSGTIDSRDAAMILQWALNNKNFSSEFDDYNPWDYFTAV